MKNNKQNPLSRLPVLLVLCTVIVTFVSPNSAQAQAWRFEPIVKVGVGLDDNARFSFRTDEEVNLTGLLMDLRADFYYATPSTSFTFKPNIVLRRYPDEPDFDSNDVFLQSNFDHVGQLSTLGFRVNFDRQEIRTAELSAANLEIDSPDEITNDDSGRLSIFGTRNKWRFSPYWKYQMSTTSTIGVDIDYFDVRYSEGGIRVLDDYSDIRLNLNYRRSFSDVTQGIITATSRRYETEGSLKDITGYGVMVGFEHALTEKTALTAMIGLEDTQQSQGNSDPEVVGLVTLVRDLQTIRMFARYQRSINSSGVGKLSVRDSLNVNFQRRLNEKTFAGIGIRAYESRGTGNSVSVDDRRYMQLQASFVWYLSKAWVIEADYRYTIIDRSDILQTRANSNQLKLWFVYQPRTSPKI